MRETEQIRIQSLNPSDSFPVATELRSPIRHLVVLAIFLKGNNSKLPLKHILKKMRIIFGNG